MSDQSVVFHVVLLLLIVSSLLVGHNGVKEGASVSEEEDKELEKQLELLNKPAVKTIQTDYGDIIDCVDFYKQPAFDHPLLKNHTFHYQMKPISINRGTRYHASPKFTKPASVKLKGGGCPVGTVPIRRLTKEDLIRERVASRITPLEYHTPGAHNAVIRTRADSKKKFFGAGAIISLHNPHVDGRQYSAAKVKIQNGPDSIEAGWRVDPSLYGDTRTRFFIRLDAGQSHCFNTRCPGFVIVKSDEPLESVFYNVSVPGGQRFIMQTYIARDKANGNWWLLDGDNYSEIGFWPKRIFTGLGDLANHVEWGGEAFGPPGSTTPPMGGGYYPIGTTKFDAFFRLVNVLNEYGQTVDVDNTEEFSDNNKLYKVVDRGNVGGQYGHYFVYGGPGGKSTQV
ncbi:protein neprosin-like [Rhododendron vialii]|uniref:protein neprosin-like n=1 Tax=Rhododendron vialii TaxID=182163 RepID=UPI00265E9F7B|nr:protein neprosin-like [Rhododendron vialii]